MTSNTQVIPFRFENTEVRVVEQDGQPWFVGKDICRALEIKNSKDALGRLDKDGVGIADLTDALGRLQKTKIINEPALYELIFQSRVEGAKKFKHWVTREVLPSIRKHGGYMNGQENMTPEELTLKAITWLQSKINEQQKQLDMQAPKVLFADSVATAKTSILVGELAKILTNNGYKTGQNRLFKQLRDTGYLSSRKGAQWNMPTQKSIDQGLFEIKESNHQQPDGTVRITLTPKVTGKGQQYFINKYLKNKRPQFDTNGTQVTSLLS